MKTVLISILVAVLLAAGCGGDDGAEPAAAAAGDGVSVVAAFYPLAEVARQVGGDRADVDDITPPGVEPHDLELTTDQVDAVASADLVVLMGRGFQPAVEDVADDRDGATVVVLDELPATADVGGEVADEEHAGGGEQALDPHVWLDPVQMGEIVTLVADALTAADPAGADTYRANAAAYRDDLDDLGAEMAAGLEGCRQRRIVTAHEAFGWLAARYGLEQEAIAGLSPDQEPDARHLAELVDLVEAEGITTIFTEALLSPAVAETLAREAGVDTAVLNPLEGLTDDELRAGENYLSVMRENLATLTAALDC